MFWMGNKENSFPIRILIWRPALPYSEHLDTMAWHHIIDHNISTSLFYKRINENGSLGMSNREWSNLGLNCLDGLQEWSDLPPPHPH